MKDEIKIGDWVTSYTKGIWQVYRIDNFLALDPRTGEDMQKTIVYSKRFINQKFRRSFSQESCNISFIQKLGSDSHIKLENFIKDNKKIYNDFNKFELKNIDTYYLAHIHSKQDVSLEQIEKLLSSKIRLSDKEITPYLKSLGLNTDDHPFLMIRFVSNNTEIVNNRVSYKFQDIFK